MRYFILLLATLTIFYACEKEPVLNIREGITFDPDTVQVDSSMKGWELYSWNSGTTWRYSLLPGTNRIKNTEEVWANNYAVDGREQLKLLLRRLPRGQEVLWLGPEWTSDNFDSPVNSFEFPPLLTQYDINEFCEMQSLTLTIVP